MLLCFMLIIRLSAKATDGVMKRGAFAFVISLLYYHTGRTVYYTTYGGEWRSDIAATPHTYMESVVRKGINEWLKHNQAKLFPSRRYSPTSKLGALPTKADQLSHGREEPRAELPDCLQLEAG